MRTLIQSPFAVLCSLSLFASSASLAKGSGAQFRPAAIWVEPIGTIAGAVEGWGYLSLGFEVPGGPTWNWMFGGGGVFAGRPGTAADGFTQVWLWNGPAFYLGGGNTPVTGFFLCPKLLGTFAIERFGGSSGSLHLGLDFGYRANAGPLYIAPVIGISAGPCFSCGDTRASPPLHVLGSPLGLRDYVELNFNFLRIGAAF